MVLGDHHFMQGMSRLPSYFTLAPFEEVARTARMVGARSKGTFPDHMFTDLSLGNTSIHTGSNLKVYGLHFVCLVQSPFHLVRMEQIIHDIASISLNFVGQYAP